MKETPNKVSLLADKMSQKMMGAKMPSCKKCGKSHGGGACKK